MSGAEAHRYRHRNKHNLEHTTDKSPERTMQAATLEISVRKDLTYLLSHSRNDHCSFYLYCIASLRLYKIHVWRKIRYIHFAYISL